MTTIACIIGLTVLACEREARRFRAAPSAASTGGVREVDLQPGLVPSAGVPRSLGPSPYEENAYGVSQGKTLYNLYNCSGCHAQGGGGMGPPLMDADWIYGSRPENIFETIAAGRPNGMPAFGGKIVSDQIWQIAAYVRSMSGLLRKDVAPGRSDDMQVRPQEQSTKPSEQP
ncbi:MAG: cytochrome c oxidase cbb3-type subunit [Gemmatimonadales bacterium]|jgi:cytochrome c oxidase cbb3-type subunit 3|nr:cytochrome c oxidase cbb3-type subunit [Gemmatimonadales bacterium]